MLRKTLIGLVVLLLLALAVVSRFFFSNTSFPEKARYIYIFSGKTAPIEIMQSLEENGLIRNPDSFHFLATQMNVWPKIREGKYEIRSGMSLFDIARMLRNGRQVPVNLVITKLRTKENLASLIGRKFESDSIRTMAFLNNADSLKKYQLDTNTVMTVIFPNTYTYLWTTPVSVIFKKLFSEHAKVWTMQRKLKADSLGLSPAETYILASIIEEETTNQAEKGMIASVYLNRLARNMNLGADPTVKFALRNFALKRIYEKQLAVMSPYNTYRYKGLPPGPICTPSIQTLDEVLNAPKTDYLFFVAKKDFTQGHIFTTNYQDHYAKEYQQALNMLEQQKQRSAKEETQNE
mgnify:CR=1 FL=1